MSRQPIRDALNRLAAEGLVEIVPQVGSVVVAPSPRDVSDAIALLRACEVKAVELAATRRSEANLRRLLGIYHEIDRLGDRYGMSAIQLSNAYRVLNRDFHLAIHDAVGSPTLASLARVQHKRVEVMVVEHINTSRMFTPEPESLDERRDAFTSALQIFRDRNAGHFEIIAAIRAQDSSAASLAMREHFARGFDFFFATGASPCR